MTKKHSKNRKQKTSSLKSWAFSRPYCSPEGGNVVAKTPQEAIKLVHYAYGFASDTSVYCAETGETFVENNNGEIELEIE